MPEVYFAGIDAGGSKTRAIITGSTGEILAAGEAGPANYQSIGQQAAFSALDAALNRALAAAGLAAGQVNFACLGAAGMDRQEDFAVFQNWAAAAFPTARVKLVNDAQIVLAAGTPAGWGLALISGTGSIAYGRSPDGRVARSGGWGYLLGDEGSGYEIGLTALKAVLRASDGRGPETRLVEAVLAEWGLARPQELIRKVYSGLPRAEIAKLAALVEGCAQAGDGRAAQILSSAGSELFAIADAAAKQLGLTGPIPTALTGGVLVRGQHVRAALLEKARARDLQLNPVTLVDDPALGAVRLALELQEQ